MNIAKGFILLLVFGIIFGVVVFPTYIQMTNQPSWSHLETVAPGWLVAALKFMPAIAAIGIIYAIYKHFANKKDEPPRPDNFPDMR
jgi:uncharacterized protein (DUF983 family)